MRTSSRSFEDDLCLGQATFPTICILAHSVGKRTTCTTRNSAQFQIGHWLHVPRFRHLTEAQASTAGLHIFLDYNIMDIAGEVTPILVSQTFAGHASGTSSCPILFGIIVQYVLMRLR